jgi:hypothetical protein
MLRDDKYMHTDDASTQLWCAMDGSDFEGGVGVLCTAKCLPRIAAVAP